MKSLQVRILSVVLAVLVVFQLGALCGQFMHGGLAQADPIGMSASGGKNPIVSVTGTQSTTSLTTLYTVPSDKIFVVTDINVSGLGGQYDTFRFYNATKGVYIWAGSWEMYGYTSTGYHLIPQSTFHSNTGIALAPGTIVQGQGYNGYSTYYTITGYLARP